MEFGRVNNDELEAIDFALPPDVMLSTHNPSGELNQTTFFIGCAKWGRKDWVGTVYPPKTREADFLAHYARHFNSIELNATFYKLPRKAQAEKWSEKVGESFLFCPKNSQSNSHKTRLKKAAETTERFLDGIAGFGNKLGPVLLMPHPAMGPKSLDTLSEYLDSLPDDINVFVELRHPDWFDRDTITSVCNILSARNAGFVVTDASGRRDCVHMHFTIPEAFIRFVGNGLHPTDYTRIDAWVERIGDWMSKGIRKVYFFMHQHEELHSPVLCKYLIEQLNHKLNLNIPVPALHKAES